MRDPENTSVEAVLKRFDEQHMKYKFMDANLSQKKKRWAWLGSFALACCQHVGLVEVLSFSTVPVFFKNTLPPYST